MMKKKPSKSLPLKKSKKINLVSKELEIRVKKMEQLMGFSSLLNSSLDASMVQEKALIATCELIVCETATLYLLDEDTRELYFESVLGEAGKLLQKTLRIPINENSYAGLCAYKVESFFKNNLVDKAQNVVNFKTRSIMCAPLLSKGRLIGVLQAINKVNDAFDESDLKLFESLSHQVAIAVDNSKLYERLKTSFYNTAEALTEAIEKKDRYTGGHSKRVAFYTVTIAESMGFTKADLGLIRLSAILHDIGKIGIEDKILKKGAPLDEYEWPIMKEHPELGFQIMNKVKDMQIVIDGMRYHHERHDGKGYPKGLKGSDIPLVARIISVADTYDAMVSTRPYRKGMDPEIAFNEINKHCGTQFCPEVVDAFNKAYHLGKFSRKQVKKLIHTKKQIA